MTKTSAAGRSSSSTLKPANYRKHRVRINRERHAATFEKLQARLAGKPEQTMTLFGLVTQSGLDVDRTLYVLSNLRQNKIVSIEISQLQALARICKKHSAISDTNARGKVIIRELGGLKQEERAKNLSENARVATAKVTLNPQRCDPKFRPDALEA